MGSLKKQNIFNRTFRRFQDFVPSSIVANRDRMLNIVNIKQKNDVEKVTRKSIKKERVEVSSLKTPKQAVKKLTKKQRGKSKKTKIKIPLNTINKTIIRESNDSVTLTETNKIQSFVPSDSNILKKGLVTPADSIKHISTTEKSHPEIINNPINPIKPSSNNVEANEISLDTVSSTMTSQSLQRMIEHEATFFSEPRDFGRIRWSDEFDFDTSSTVELYLEMLSATNFEGTLNNFALNQRLLNHIKDEYKYRPCMKDPETRSSLFKEMFKSILFSKEYLKDKLTQH